MKKLLALVLALVMTLSLATVGTNAFTDDAQVKNDYAEAVQVLTGMNVFKGYTDNSFKPLNDITRAEVAAIVYRIYTADVNDKQASVYAGYGKFDDVNTASWYAGYVGYCTNAGFIKGYGDGKFGPNDKVTGYQALAMILRAVGYGKNGEFEGKDWELHVAQVAQQIGALVNVKGESLKAPASRQLVAELLFQCLQAAQVVYTPAFGYAPVSIIAGQKSLGEKNFNLKYSYNSDVWGRPAKVWTYTTGNKKTTLADAPAASYTVKVDECDISKDLGINSTAKLEKAFIDGVEYKTNNPAVTGNGVASINPRATTSYVGAQGRLTEVYDMGSDGYRIVEINTYLANVAKVTAEKTDKNGHKTAATIDLNVYLTSGNPVAFKGVEATGFTKNEYVLVTISNPGTKDENVESVVAAPIVAGGELSGWTKEVGLKAGTSIFGKTSYNEANKFFLNKHVDGFWAVLTDTYGNIIGMAQVANNYLVVEKIEWKHHATSIGAGYALADLVLADGSKVANATVATINGLPANNKSDWLGDPDYGNVSDDYENNELYYGHILTYSVNDNGSYNLAYVDHTTRLDTNPVDLDGATITKGQATIYNKNNTFVATNKTVFLLADQPGVDGTTYTAYVGKNEVKSIQNANLCILTDGNGYAVLVVARNYLDKGSKFIAYVTDNDKDRTRSSFGADAAGYEVYKLGETDATVVYGALYNAKYVDTGLYEFTLNAKGIVTDMVYISRDLNKATSAVAAEGYDIDRVALKEDELGTSFQTYEYTGLAEADNDFGYSFGKDNVAAKDFNRLDDTKIIRVYKAGMNGDVVLLEEGNVYDLAKGAVVIVAYDVLGTYKFNANVIYVLYNNGVPAEAEKDVELVLDKTTMDSEKGPEIVVSLYDEDGNAYTPKKAITEKDVKIKIINDDTDTEVHSTAVEAKLEGNELTITANTKLSQGSRYYARLTIKIDGVVYSLKTPVIEAQPVVSGN